MIFTPKTILPFIAGMLWMLPSCAPADLPQTTPPEPTQPTIILPTPGPTEPACTSLDFQPTPGPDSPSLFPPVNSKDHIRGAENAAVTIIVYNDFQCTDCNYLPLSQSLLANHPEDVRIVYRPYPYRTLFDKGVLAAQAAEAANAQGKFWELHDLLFEKQAQWVDLPVDAFEGWITARAGEIGLDQAQFTEDFHSLETVEKVQNAADEGARTGISRLPFLLLNGQIYDNPTTFEAISEVISLIKLGERQFTKCPSVTIDPSKQYIATLHTEKGEIVLQLFPEKAPLAVNSFVFLARNGWYNNITFHRVLPGFVAQTGDPSGTGQGNPGYMFKNETDPTLTFDQAGLVAMANSGPGTNGSQFFITYSPAPHLSGSYTIFGQVLSGMQVLEQLTSRDPQPGIILPPGDRLISVTVKEE